MNVLVESLRFRIQEPDRGFYAEIEGALSALARSGGEGSDSPRDVLILGPTAPIEIATIPAIAFCKRADRVRRIQAVRAGVTETVTWPIEKDELSFALERAIEKRRLRSELDLVRRDIEALVELSDSLISTHDISGTLLQICQRVAEVMRADRCSIVLLDDEAMRGFVVAASDDSSMKDHRIDIAKYPEISEVVRTGEPLVINDVQRAPLFDPVREEIRGKPVAGTTLFPVRIDRRVQGVLILRESRVRTRGLDDREIRFGRIVANATAIAIRNARLYEMIRDTSERRLSERLKAERRLRQIEKYQRFFDFAGDGLMIVDGGARILFANRAARSILGFDAPAISQITLYDIVEPKDREALDDVMQGVQSGRHQSSRDLAVVRASGDVAILSLTTASLEDTAPTGEFPIFHKDQTSKEGAAAALAAPPALPAMPPPPVPPALAAAPVAAEPEASGQPDAIAAPEPGSVEEAVEAVDVDDLPEEEAVSVEDAPAEDAPAEDAPAEPPTAEPPTAEPPTAEPPTAEAAPPVERVERVEPVEPVEPIAPTRSTSQTGRGDVTAIISFRDVTATRAMQEELRRTKDFLLNLIESSADAIVAADMDGRILLFNKVAARITGYSAPAAIGKNVAMLYPPGVARDIMLDLRSESHGGVGKLQDRRQSLLTSTGDLVPINLAAAIVYDGGREVATVGIFSDLRERLRMEETLQKAQRQLELSERQTAVVELAGAAAHELNQPLTSIMGSAELLARKVPDTSPVGRALVRTIVTESERMAEIVRKLGHLTKYETKPYVGVTHIVDLDAASQKGK